MAVAYSNVGNAMMAHYEKRKAAEAANQQLMATIFAPLKLKQQEAEKERALSWLQHEDRYKKEEEARVAEREQTLEKVALEARLKNQGALSLEMLRQQGGDKNLEAKTVMVNGVPTLANYNSKLGTYHDVNSGEQIVGATPMLSAGLQGGEGVLSISPEMQPSNNKLNPQVLDELLATGQLGAGEIAKVKQLAAYNDKPLSGNMLKNTRMQKIWQAVALYNPLYDASKYSSVLRTRNDFSSGGKGGQNIRSLNTLIGHIDWFDEKAANLKNTTLPKANKVKNYFLQETGAGEVKAFEQAQNAIIEEANRLFRGSGQVTQKAVDEWRQSFSINSSPEQFRDAIDSLIRLMESRMFELIDQYERGIDMPKDRRFINPKAREILKKHGYDIDQIDRVDSFYQSEIQGDGRPPLESFVR